MRSCIEIKVSLESPPKFDLKLFTFVFFLGFAAAETVLFPIKKPPSIGGFCIRESSKALALSIFD